MIATLEGKVTALDADRIVLELSGVGYEVFCPERAISGFSVGQNLRLHIYHHIKEDAQNLFGFETLFEKKVFVLLISVSGVGPRTASQILSAMNPDQLIRAVLQSQTAAFGMIKGIGKKTAERIILELRDKVKNIQVGETANAVVSSVSIETQEGSVLADARAALLSLGYKYREIENALQKAGNELTQAHDVETVIKRLLQFLT